MALIIPPCIVRVCRACDEPYPPTPEYFYTTRGGNGKLYLMHVCKGCHREKMAANWERRGRRYNARRNS